MRELEDKARHEDQNKANEKAKPSDLKELVNTAKLATPLPADLVGIVGKDPEKQKKVFLILQQSQEIVEQRVAADDGTPERVKNGPVTPNSPVSHVESLVGKQPTRITTPTRMTWAERAAQPAPRPTSTDLSGGPATAPVKGVKPKAEATGHVDGNSDQQGHDFHLKNPTGTRLNAQDTPGSAVTIPVQAARSQRGKGRKRRGGQYAR